MRNSEFRTLLMHFDLAIGIQNAVCGDHRVVGELLQAISRDVLSEFSQADDFDDFGFDSRPPQLEEPLPIPEEQKDPEIEHMMEPNPQDADQDRMPVEGVAPATGFAAMILGDEETSSLAMTQSTWKSDLEALAPKLSPVTTIHANEYSPSIVSLWSRTANSRAVWKAARSSKWPKSYSATPQG